LNFISVQLTFKKVEEIQQREGEGGKGIIRRRNRRMRGEVDIGGTIIIITTKATEHF